MEFSLHGPVIAGCISWQKKKQHPLHSSHNFLVRKSSLLWCVFPSPLCFLWQFNFNIHFCSCDSAHNGYPGHCFRLSSNHVNFPRLSSDTGDGNMFVLWYKWLEECNRVPGRERIISIYQNQKHFDRKKKTWSSEKKKKKKNIKVGWGWENKVKRHCFVAQGRWPGKMCPRSDLFETINF